MKIRYFLSLLFISASLLPTVTIRRISSIDQCREHLGEDDAWLFSDIDDTLVRSGDQLEGFKTVFFLMNCNKMNRPVFALTARHGHEMSHRDFTVQQLQKLKLNIPLYHPVDSVFDTRDTLFYRMEDANCAKSSAEMYEDGIANEDYLKWLNGFRYRVDGDTHTLVHECHYQDSVIFTGGGGKGPAFIEFLKILKNNNVSTPKRFMFIDDNDEQVESMEVAFKNHPDIHIDIFHIAVPAVVPFVNEGFRAPPLSRSDKMKKRRADQALEEEDENPRDPKVARSTLDLTCKEDPRLL